jgi:hypothetical protein
VLALGEVLGHPGRHGRECIDSLVPRGGDTRVAGGAATDVVRDERLRVLGLYTLSNSTSTFESSVSTARNLNVGVVDAELHRGRGPLSAQGSELGEHLIFHFEVALLPRPPGIGERSGDRLFEAICVEGPGVDVLLAQTQSDGAEQILDPYRDASSPSFVELDTSFTGTTVPWRDIDLLQIWRSPDVEPGRS